MIRGQRQEFCIKSAPTDDIPSVEAVLNSMSKDGWDLYSIYEGELNNKVVYNIIFTREIEIEDNDDIDIQGYKTMMEKMFSSKEEPYELCLNFQKKIKEKREKIDEIKNFLDGAKEDERAVLNEEIAKEVDRLNSLKKQLKSLLSPSKMASNLGEERLSISLSEENYCLNDPYREKNLLSQTIKTRQELTKELGYIIPKVQFLENSELEDNSFTINVHGVPVISGFAYPNYKAFYEDDLNMDEFPPESITDIDPTTTRPIIWIKDEYTKDYWTQGLGPNEYIAKCLKYFSIKHVNEIFNYSDMNRYIEIVSDNNPLIIDTILGDFISIGELKYIFCSLIRERISVKDVIYVFEKINDFADDNSKADLLEKLRISLSRQICWSISNKDKEIEAYELSDELISALEENAVEPDEGESIVKIDGLQFEDMVRKIAEISLEKPVVLVVPGHIRAVVFALVSQLYMDIPTISFDEIAPEFELKILGKI